MITEVSEELFDSIFTSSLNIDKVRFSSVLEKKLNAKDKVLDEITRKKTHLLWPCRENGPNAISKNYD